LSEAPGMKTHDVRLVGRRISRVDGKSKSSGYTRFVNDIGFPGMVHAAMVKAGHPHASIVDIDISRVSTVSGVVGVVTARDVPGENRVGLVKDDQPLFASDRVRYEADCIALVVAETPYLARRAAELVKVTFENLPHISSLDDAKAPNAVMVHDDGNLAVERRIVKGAIEIGESQSDHVVEAEFHTPVQEHAYLETVGAIAVPFGRKMEIWVAAQCPFYVRDAVARCLGARLADVRVIQLPIGGGFGGKEDVPSEICARLAVLARQIGRPVKMVLTREEDILYTSKRHPMKLTYRMGCKVSGELQFADILIEADVGAYATLSPIVLFRSTIHAAGPYEIPNVRILTRGYYTNTVPKGAMRGFGTPQVVFACESVIDELALKAAIDPLEFRAINALKKGSRTATDQVLKDSVGLPETIRRAKKHFAGPWSRRSKGKVTGRGVASMFYGVSLGAAGRHLDRGAARVEILKDGSINVWVGCTDMGQGARTVLAQIVAEDLGVSVEQVQVNHVDTDIIADSGPTVASRTTVVSGNAILDACSKLKRILFSIAGEMSGSKITGISKGAFVAESGKALDFKKVVAECYLKRIDLSALGWYVVPDCRLDDSGLGDAYYVYSYATDVAEVEVDTETGEIQIKDFLAVHDSGRIINPMLAEGQVEGGIAQGIGFALHEMFSERDGHVASRDLSTYLIPTSLDVCDRMSVEFVERLSRDGPFGAKGLGEPAIIPVAAAIANAVSRALGRRVTCLPITREWVIEQSITS